MLAIKPTTTITIRHMVSNRSVHLNVLQKFCELVVLAFIIYIQKQI